jgi:hypothetical protein
MSEQDSGSPSVEGAFVPIEQVAGVAKEAQIEGAVRGDIRKPRPHIAFKEMVAGRLASSGPQVRDAVVSSLVDVQLARRQKAVLSILEKLDAKDKELRKAESAGTQTFDGKGNVTGVPSFTKDQIDSMRKLREEIQKMEGALSKALESNDWQKLFEVTGENKG